MRDSEHSLLNMLRKDASQSDTLKYFKICFVKCLIRNYEDS